VSYRFRSSTGDTTETRTITFPSAGTRSVSYTAPEATGLSGPVALEVLAPHSVSEMATAVIRCE
jgi:hypothetical protein